MRTSDSAGHARRLAAALAPVALLAGATSADAATVPFDVSFSNRGDVIRRVTNATGSFVETESIRLSAATTRPSRLSTAGSGTQAPVLGSYSRVLVTKRPFTRLPAGVEPVRPCAETRRVRSEASVRGTVRLVPAARRTRPVLDLHVTHRPSTVSTEPVRCVVRDLATGEERTIESPARTERGLVRGETTPTLLSRPGPFSLVPGVAKTRFARVTRDRLPAGAAVLSSSVWRWDFRRVR